MKTAALSPRSAASTGVGPEPCSSPSVPPTAGPARPPPKPHPSCPPPPKSHPSSPPPPRPSFAPLSSISTPSRPPPPTAKPSSAALPPPLTPSLPPPLTPSLPPPLIPSSPSLSPSVVAKPSSAALPPPLTPSSAPLTPALPPSSPPLPPTLAPFSPPSISLLERLIRTCPVWLQLGMNQERSSSILGSERPGVFLVRRGFDQKAMVLSVRLADLQEAPQVQDFVVREDRSFIHLERSVLFFDNIFKLVSHYCVSRDVLPITLRLPKVIVQATKYEDMEVVSTLGSDFWGSMLNSQWEDGEQGAGLGEERPEGGWYINPVPLEEHCSGLQQTSDLCPVSRSQSLTTPSPKGGPKYKRPPPRPPNVPEPLLLLSQGAKLPASPRGPPSSMVRKEEGKEKSREGVSLPLKTNSAQTSSAREAGSRPPPPPHLHRAPPVALPRRPSDRQRDRQKDAPAALDSEPPASLICLEENLPANREPGGGAETQEAETGTVAEQEKDGDGEKEAASGTEREADGEKGTERDRGGEMEGDIGVEPERDGATEARTDSEGGTTQGGSGLTGHASGSSLRKPPLHPVPPPRRKRPSLTKPNIPEHCSPAGGRPLSLTSPLRPPPTTPPWSVRKPASVVTTGGDARASDVSLYSPEGGAGPAPDQDSTSTASSTEDEGGGRTTPTTRGGGNNAIGGGRKGCSSPKAGVKRTSTIILDRAKQRLSMVNLSNVLTGLLSADSKLQKRIVELSRDGSSYLGSLVRDHRAFALETMGKHSSSTEMLQEIRQMLTQLKSYLIQSTELQGLLETSVYTQERLETIVEAALCKSVLKPLKDAVYTALKELHTREGSMKRLRENQALVLATTSTDLGVTTSVPETAVMEKISSKLWNLHEEYSPQRKIDMLLKTCKIIYESMSVGCPGRAHGADDFLPVLMYVLARTNMAVLMLDVEYMMELMDPALQLGEGSYYLTTTYGAVEHIKNFDKQPVTRQLSLEVQDSIHRWERRRTFNKASMTQTAVQDFITVSLLEAGSNPKTLGVQAITTVKELCEQCAAKFEVPDPDAFGLSVLVDGEYRSLGPEERPLAVKTSLHHAERCKDYGFVYRHGNRGPQDADGRSPPPLPPPPPPTQIQTPPPPTLISTLPPPIAIQTLPSPTLIQTPPSPTLIPTPPPSTLIQTLPSPTLIPTLPSPTLMPTPPPSTVIETPPSPTLNPTPPSPTLIQTLPSPTLNPTPPSPTLIPTPPPSTLIQTPTSPTLIQTLPPSTLIQTPLSPTTASEESLIEI